MTALLWARLLLIAVLLVLAGAHLWAAGVSDE
jgi:hypothetical protein